MVAHTQHAERGRDGCDARIDLPHFVFARDCVESPAELSGYNIARLEFIRTRFDDFGDRAACDRFV